MKRGEAPCPYALIIDCGSSGTRLYAYEWCVTASDRDRVPKLRAISPSAAPDKVPKNPEKVLYNRLETHPGVDNVSQDPAVLYNRVETHPGVDKFSQDPVGLRHRALGPLLEWAQAVVPIHEWATTPIFLFATAGVRRLPKSDQSALMQSVSWILSGSGFRFDPSWAQVIDGADEGAFGWVALNYVRRSFGGSNLTRHQIPMGGGALPPGLQDLQGPFELKDGGGSEKSSTVGVLDMGGSSLEITIAVSDIGGSPGARGQDNGFGDVQGSLAGFGLNDAFDRSISFALRLQAKARLFTQSLAGLGLNNAFDRSISFALRLQAKVNLELMLMPDEQNLTGRSPSTVTGGSFVSSPIPSPSVGGQRGVMGGPAEQAQSGGGESTGGRGHEQDHHHQFTARELQAHRGHATEKLGADAGSIDRATGQLGADAGSTDHATGQLGADAGRVDHATGQLGADAGSIDHATGQQGADAGSIDHATGQQGADAGSIDHAIGQLGADASSIDRATGQLGANARSIDHATGQLGADAGSIDHATGQLGADAGSIDHATGQLGADAGSIDHATGQLGADAGSVGGRVQGSHATGKPKSQHALQPQALSTTATMGITATQAQSTTALLNPTATQAQSTTATLSTTAIPRTSANLGTTANQGTDDLAMASKGGRPVERGTTVSTATSSAGEPAIISQHLRGGMPTGMGQPGRATGGPGGMQAKTGSPSRGLELHKLPEVHHPCLQEGFNRTYQRKENHGVKPGWHQLQVVGSPDSSACQELIRQVVTFTSASCLESGAGSEAAGESGSLVGNGAQTRGGGMPNDSRALQESWEGGMPKAVDQQLSCAPALPEQGLQDNFFALSGFYIVWRFFHLDSWASQEEDNFFALSGFYIVWLFFHLDSSASQEEDNFVALSGFYIVWRFFHLDSSASQEEVVAATEKYCSTAWEEAVHEAGNNDNFERYCPGDVGWPLGALLVKASKLSSQHAYQETVL
eukprot:gene8755-33617_t